MKKTYVSVRSHRRAVIVEIALYAVSLVLNIAAWKSTSFSEWYTLHIFPLWTKTYGRLTSLTRVSVGERMILIGILWLVLLALATVLFIFLHRRKGYRRFFRGLWYATSWIVCIVLLVMTLNCVILYHRTPLERSLKGYGSEYSLEDLANLRDLIVEKCNTLSGQMPRDAEGEVLYEGGEAAMAETARESVRALGGTIPGFSAFEVTPKALTFSAFVSQQYMQGYYFPFAMEAGYNHLMKIMNKPFTMCHELSHTHGYIYEDDANFLGFLACIRSEDPVFCYSGWLGVLNYVNNSFYENVSRSVYDAHPAISAQVQQDNEFLSEQAWALVGKRSPLDTKTVKKAADNYLDTTLKANGVSSGKASYSHVVALLLEYFDGDFSSVR